MDKKDIDIISSEYASLYKEMVETIFKECSHVSKTQSDAELDNYLKKITDEYVSQLSSSEIALINRMDMAHGTRSPSASKIAVPEYLINKIKPLIVDADTSLLADEINKFYISSDYLGLEAIEQQELKLQLESLVKVRNSMIEILTKYYQPHEITRMSPGDRMIWSDMANQMNDKQRSNVIDASLYGVGLVCSPFYAGVVGAIGLFKSIFC